MNLFGRKKNQLDRKSLENEWAMEMARAEAEVAEMTPELNYALEHPGTYEEREAARRALRNPLSDAKRLAYYRSHGLTCCDDYPGGDAKFEADVLSGEYHDTYGDLDEVLAEDAYIIKKMKDGTFVFGPCFESYCRNRMVMEVFASLYHTIPVEVRYRGVMIMSESSSFTGLKLGDRLLTNGQAYAYLTRLFSANKKRIANAVVDVDVNELDFVFISEKEARSQTMAFDLHAGEGRVLSSFDWNDNPSIKHKVSSLVVVGHDDLFDESKADDPVDAYQFLCMIAAIDHEFRHVRQHLGIENREGSDLGKLFFLNQWATCGSPAYTDIQYMRDVNEIDAQCFALKRLGLHVAGFKDFKLVDVGRTDKGFTEIGPSGKYDKMRPVDAALVFYHDKRNETVPDDFIEYPDGGHTSAGSIIRKFYAKFVKSIYEPRTWDLQSESGNVYKNMTDYVERNAGDDAENDAKDAETDAGRNGKRKIKDVLAQAFKANPEHLSVFNNEKDGFRQLLMEGMMATLACGSQSLQETLYARISEKFGLDLRPGVTFGPDRDIVSAFVGPGKRMAVKTSIEMVLDTNADVKLSKADLPDMPAAGPVSPDAKPSKRDLPDISSVKQESGDAGPDREPDD